LLEELEYERAPLQYFYTRQRELLGLGHAIQCSEPFVGNQPFVTALGDSIIGMHAKSDIVQRMTRCFLEKQAAAVIAFEKVPLEEVHRYGIAKPKTEGDLFEIEDLIEKPSRQEAPSNLAIAARYVFAPAIFEAIKRTAPGKGGEIQITDAIRLLIKDGRKVYGMCLRADERRYDIGNFQAYFRAFVEFALEDEKQGPALRKHLEALLDNHS
jgi:UTP--glucose-1-phosphate uridylyltransferase